MLARFRKMVGPASKAYEADYEAIAELQKIASDTGVAILVIHHTRKGEADDPVDWCRERSVWRVPPMPSW